MAMKNNYVGSAAASHRGVANEAVYKKSIKLLYSPQEEPVGSPQLVSHFYRPADPSVPPVTYSTNTTITNNTNIILVGGKNFKISSTSGHSPREIVPKPSSVTNYATQPKAASARDLVTPNRPVYQNRVLIKRILSKIGSAKAKGGNTTFVPLSTLYRPSFDDRIHGARPPSETSTIGHKRSMSGAHVQSQKEMNRTVAVPSQPAVRVGVAAVPELMIKKSGEKEGKPKPKQECNTERRRPERKESAGAGGRHEASSSDKATIIGGTHRKNAKSEVPSNDNSIDLSAMQPGSRPKKPVTETHTIILDTSGAKIGRPKPDGQVWAELKKELKLDPKREKELVEVSEAIKKRTLAG